MCRWWITGLKQSLQGIRSQNNDTLLILNWRGGVGLELTKKLFPVQRFYDARRYTHILCSDSALYQHFEPKDCFFLSVLCISVRAARFGQINKHRDHCYMCLLKAAFLAKRTIRSTISAMTHSGKKNAVCSRKALVFNEWIRKLLVVENSNRMTLVHYNTGLPNSNPITNNNVPYQRFNELPHGSTR